MQTPNRLLFNAGSEEIARAKFRKESFHGDALSFPADSFFDWERVKTRKRPKFEFTVPGRKPFGMADCGLPGKTTKPANGNIRCSLIVCKLVSRVSASDEPRSEAAPFFRCTTLV